MTTKPTQRARVIANYGGELVIMDASLSRKSAVPLKKLGLIVCGDIIDFIHESGINRVVALVKRTSTLSRTDRRGQAKPVAANITQLVAVTAPKPQFDPLLIDRYAVAARHIDVDLLIVINKVDALDDITGATAQELQDIYTGIGYRVSRCSTKQHEGTSDLRRHLSNQVSILVGQSGVGKSSILAELLPDQNIKVGALSENSGLGKHTTTVTTWFDLPDGGAIIDSAGVRQFGLDHLNDIDLQTGFTEINDLSATCKFNDCSHTNEPECAVLTALQDKRLARQRYEHFLYLRDNQD
ncbi:ribosome small subunit-dependent GTPase A [Chromatiales bacterium (ex Bugula neritina AB1)]|nr:ribosome small subunit-dependent GTPase A [Chromatiales bacterium (ex Bugula neritina AB1)]